MASITVAQQLPTSTQQAIEVFNERYLAVLGAAPPSDWAQRFIQTVDSPITKYPMSFLSGKFRETKDESGRYQGMDDKYFELGVVEYDNGYEAKMTDLLSNVFAWKRWGEVPGRFIVQEARHHAKQLVTLLEAGTTTACKYDDVNFFSASHLANPSDPAGTTWSNYQSSTKAPTLVNIQAEMTLMEGAVRDENGDKLNATPKEIWLPTEKFEGTAALLNQAFLATGESNYMAGKIKPVHVPELTDPDDWYLVDTDLMSQFDPMMAARYPGFDSALGLRFLDESSDHYKKTGKIAVSKHIWCGYALLFPHAIRLVKGA